jgi:hypothetical protein
MSTWLSCAASKAANLEQLFAQYNPMTRRRRPANIMLAQTDGQSVVFDEHAFMSLGSTKVFFLRP